MGLPARAVVVPFVTQPEPAPVDWRIIASLCRELALEGDRDFLDYIARRLHARRELIRSAKALIDREP